jgi:hypothetical protein
MADYQFPRPFLDHLQEQFERALPVLFTGAGFSTEVAERLANRVDPWYLRLTADLFTRCFVFVGTSLDEPPLWQHLAIRRERGRPFHREKVKSSARLRLGQREERGDHH